MILQSETNIKMPNGQNFFRSTWLLGFNLESVELYKPEMPIFHKCKLHGACRNVKFLTIVPNWYSWSISSTLTNCFDDLYRMTCWKTVRISNIPGWSSLPEWISSHLMKSDVSQWGFNMKLVTNVPDVI